MSMKVKITAYLEVDEQEWANEYGMEPNRKEVRDDVKRYVDTLLRDSYHGASGIWEVVT